jgi:hypothetical protein
MFPLDRKTSKLTLHGTKSLLFFGNQAETKFPSSTEAKF